MNRAGYGAVSAAGAHHHNHGGGEAGNTGRRAKQPPPPPATPKPTPTILLLLIVLFAAALGGAGAAQHPAAGEVAAAATQGYYGGLALSVLPPTLQTSSYGLLIIHFTPPAPGYFYGAAQPAALPPANLTVYLSTNAPQSVAVPPSVVAQAGQPYVVVRVNTTATPGQATITATATGYNPAQVDVDVAEPSGYPTQIRLTAMPANPVAQPAFTGSLLVELTDQEGDPAQAPTNTTVSLSSSNPQVAAAQPQAFIPAGETFTVAHYNTSLRVGQATITATATGYTAGSTQIEVSGPQPYSVEAALAPTTPAPGEPVTLTVWLTDQQGDPAQTPVPVSVALTSSNTTMLNPPTTVVIPPGAYYTQVEFRAGSAGAQGEQATITAASTGLQPATLQAAVEQPARSGGAVGGGGGTPGGTPGETPTLVVETQPGPLIADNAHGERVLLVELEAGGAPLYTAGGGLNITLRSSNPGAVRVPQSVTLPPNTTYILVPVNTTYQPGSAVVTAAAPNTEPASPATVTTYGYTPTAIEVEAPSTPLPTDGRGVYALAVSFTSSAAGFGQTMGIAPQSVQVNLYSSNPEVVQVPPTVTIPAGGGYTLIAVNTTGTAGSAQITLTTAEYGSATVEVDTVQPGATTLTLSVAPPTAYTLLPPTPTAAKPTLTEPPALAAIELYSARGEPAQATGPISVVVASENATLLPQPITITIPGKQSFAVFPLNPAAAGELRLTVSAPGLTPPQQPAQLTVEGYPITLQVLVVPGTPAAGSTARLIVVANTSAGPLQDAPVEVEAPPQLAAAPTQLTTNMRGVAEANISSPTPGAYTLNITLGTPIGKLEEEYTVHFAPPYTPTATAKPNPYATTLPIKPMVLGAAAAVVGAAVYLNRGRIPGLRGNRGHGAGGGGEKEGEGEGEGEGYYTEGDGEGEDSGEQEADGGGEP